MDWTIQALEVLKKLPSGTSQGTFDNNLGIKNDFTKYWKESC